MIYTFQFKKIAFGDNLKRFSQVVYRKVFYTFLYHIKNKKLRLIYNCLVFVLVFYLAGLWFYRSASLHLNAYNNFLIYNAEDANGHDQIAWNTSRGRLFQYDDRIISPGHKNAVSLGNHSSFIFLLIALFYILFPHFSSFIIAQSLFMGLSSIALYLVARQMLTEKRILPLLIFFIYVQSFLLFNLSHYFHPEQFSILFLLLMFYFYLRKKLKPTLIFAILSICCREDIALVIAVLGIVSWFQTERRKFFLPLALMGMISFLFIYFILFSVFNGETTYLKFKELYGYLGKTFFEKISNIFIHPQLAINNFLRPEKIAVFKDIFGPFLYLPFLSPLLFLPGLVIVSEVMFAEGAFTGSLRQPWYLAALAPFIFIGIIGLFQKIYRIEKLPENIFPKLTLYRKWRFCRISIKVFSVILILILFYRIYTYNSRLGRYHYNQFQEYFAIDRYWYADTFGILSDIRRNTRLTVISPLKIITTISAREHIGFLTCLENPAVVNQGFYDIIILSESEEAPDINQFNYIEKSPLYKKIYYTPHIRIFAKNNTPIDSWKFDLISKIRDSSAGYNYALSNFTDFSTILENSGAISSEELVKSFYQNSKGHYAVLGLAQKISQFLEDDNKLTYFVSDKPLETGYAYILAFAAKTEEGSGTVYIAGPEGSSNSDTEVRIDAKLRLYMIPFKVSSFIEAPTFSMQLTRSSSVTKPVLFRSPYKDELAQEPILTTRLNKYAFSYNPWIRPDAYKSKGITAKEFLLRYLDNNPMILFMKLLRLSIPLDLYKYKWVSDYKKGDELVAVRYSR